MNFQLLSKVKKLFRLTQQYLIYSSVAALLIFIIEYLPIIYNVLEGGYSGASGYLEETVSELIARSLQDISDRPYVNIITVMVIYCAIGAALLAFFLGLKNILILTKNEISQDLGKKPPKPSNALIATKLIGYIIYILFVMASLKFLMQYWTSLFDIFAYSGMAVSLSGYFLAGFVGMSLNIYVIWAIAHFIWFHEKTDKTL